MIDSVRASTLIAKDLGVISPWGSSSYATTSGFSAPSSPSPSAPSSAGTSFYFFIRAATISMALFTTIKNESRENL